MKLVRKRASGRTGLQALTDVLGIPNKVGGGQNAVFVSGRALGLVGVTVSTQMVVERTAVLNREQDFPVAVFTPVKTLTRG